MTWICFSLSIWMNFVNITVYKFVFFYINVFFCISNGAGSWDELIFRSLNCYLFGVQKK